MKKLYLVRHGKSSWKHEGVMDMDRPLKIRGIKDAYRASVWLMEQGDRPDLIISSPAIRALHTALIFSKNLEHCSSELRMEEAIYNASSKDLFHVVKDLDDKLNSVMIFGHNPAIIDFINLCINDRIDNVPTTGIVCLKLREANWKNIDKRSELTFFNYPKKRKIK